jgi:NAD(P)-dependent dehydrogenase (short-subunit alcohol dehydrogenase family)
MPSLLTTPVALTRRYLLAPVAELVGRPLPSPLDGRIVMITGASSGVGEATAKAVAARGAVVIAVARRQEHLDRVVARIRDDGGVAFGIACDLTDAAASDALVEQVLREHDHVDMLVNNAGRSIRRSLELSYGRMHDFERTMAINYFAPVRLLLGLLPHMVEQRHGHVVNVLTWGVQVKAPKFAAYIASKTALDVFSRIAGRELYGEGITFTNVRLPLVRTAMIGPTDVYRRSRALTTEQAADRVVRALEDRPLTVSTVAGNLSEVLNLVLPRISDAVSHHAAKRYPDSAAAVGQRTS